VPIKKNIKKEVRQCDQGKVAFQTCVIGFISQNKWFSGFSLSAGILNKKTQHFGNWINNTVIEVITF
jgi:hypothetical protein